MHISKYQRVINIINNFYLDIFLDAHTQFFT
jgi:hypothetical protein